MIFSQGSVYQDNQESLGDAEGYSEAVESVVFARLYRVLAAVTRRRNAGNGVMDLQEVLRGVRKEFGEFFLSVLLGIWANITLIDDWEWDEEWERSRVDVNVQHSSRLVSALVDLILHA